MKVLKIVYIHTYFEGHFEPLARSLATDPRFSQTFLTTRETPKVTGIDFIQFDVVRSSDRYSSSIASPYDRSLQIADGVRKALQKLTATPDLIVSYAGFGCSIYAPTVFPDTPVIGYFPYFYHHKNSEVDFLPNYKVPQEVLDTLPSRNAAMLLEHAHMRAGYSPTLFQASRFPETMQTWLRVLHDGIDTDVWSRKEKETITVNGITIAADKKLITYTARGLELYRGFDRALQVISAVLRERKDAVALIIGLPQCFYGFDQRFFREHSLRDYLMNTLGDEASRIHFIDWVSTDTLVEVFSRSDLHLYFTVPYTLSWSLLNAMSCGAPILASSTEPVVEVIKDGVNGMLADYFDTQEWINKSLQILSSRANNEEIWQNARETVRSKYSKIVCIPKLKEFLCSVTN